MNADEKLRCSIKMGSDTSKLVAQLATPFQMCCHDFMAICDECVCDSGCGETCCHLHLETHHTADSAEHDEQSETDENIK